MRKKIFQSGKSCLAAALQPGRLQSGNKRKNRREKNPGSIDLQCPGESKWRDSPFGPRPLQGHVFNFHHSGIVSKWRDSKRNLNRRGTPLERALRSFRLIRSPSFACGDAPPGRRSARSPPAFGPEAKILSVFPALSGIFSKAVGFFRFLPAFSACFWKFRSSLKLDIRHFLDY